MCKALSFVDACTEEHFAAMSRSSPPGFRRAGAPIFYLRGRTEFARHQGFASGKTLVRATRRGRLIHSLNEVCLLIHCAS